MEIKGNPERHRATSCKAKPHIHPPQFVRALALRLVGGGTSPGQTPSKAEPGQERGPHSASRYQGFPVTRNVSSIQGDTMTTSRICDRFRRVVLKGAMASGYRRAARISVLLCPGVHDHTAAGGARKLPEWETRTGCRRMDQQPQSGRSGPGGEHLRCPIGPGYSQNYAKRHDFDDRRVHAPRRSIFNGG